MAKTPDIAVNTVYNRRKYSNGGAITAAVAAVEILETISQRASF